MLQCVPVVHEAVNHRIVHRIRHCEPVDSQVDLLDVDVVVDGWVDVGQDEVEVVRQPADAKDEHDHDHHLHNLES